MKNFLTAISQIIPYLCKYIEDLLKLIEDIKVLYNFNIMYGYTINIKLITFTLFLYILCLW